MDPIDNIENYRFGMFYFNKNDSRVIVHKKTRWLGWTFNFSRLESYLILLLIIAIPIIVTTLFK